MVALPECLLSCMCTPYFDWLLEDSHTGFLTNCLAGVQAYMLMRLHIYVLAGKSA